MGQNLWTAVDEYIDDLLVRADAVMDDVLKKSAAAGLPPIHVSPSQGKLLSILAQSIKAKNILEIGTLGGYSTIWLARSLAKDGKVVTLEVNPHFAKVAQTNLSRAGFTNRIEIRVGQALDTLPKLTGPFDFVFIDADKEHNPDYFKWALKLSHQGSVIIVDNVVRGGTIIDGKSLDTSVLGVRRLYELLSKEKRLNATAIQTVGIKGYDGFLIALVK